MQISENEMIRRRKISESMKKYFSSEKGEEQRKRIIGRPHSEETKKKLSVLRSGEGNGMFGKHHSQEVRDLISKSEKGRKITWGRKISISKKGKVKISPLQRKMISDSLKKHYTENPNPFLGKKHSPESIEKMRLANIGRFDGENHPQWKGGLSKQPYVFNWKKISNKIIQRDKGICQNPFCKRTDKKMTAHHIDYNKKNNQEGNLITLCNSCNCSANFKRKDHQLFYSELMKKLRSK